MSGLEALGAIASVVQIIDNCLRTVLSLQTHYTDLCNAPNAIAQHKFDVEQLVEILQAIRDCPSLQTTPVASCLSDISHHTELLLKKLERVTPKTNERKIRRNWKALKFVSREKTIESSLKTLDRKINMLLNIPSTDVPFNNLPAYRTAGFVGRELLLQHMDSAVHEQEAARATVILVGMGGSGKTQLALKYCERQSASQKFVFWINAASEQTLGTAYAMIADDLEARSHTVIRSQDLDAKIRYTSRFISGLKTPWILVFDNYDDPASFPNLQSFMPSTSSSTCGTVLLTSRHPDVARLGGTTIEVGPMDEEEGVDLLLTRASIAISTDTRNLAIPIVRRLGCLALALDQAGSYLQKRKLKLSEFIEHFETQKEHVLNHTPSLWNYTRSQGDHGQESRLNVFTTWELSFHCLQRSCQPYELEFTTLLGFFHCSSISEKLLRTHCNYYCLNRAEDVDDLSIGTGQDARSENSLSGPSNWSKDFTDQNGVWNHLSFRTFLSTSVDLRLIQSFSVTEDNLCSLTIHPLVSDWMKLRIDSCARKRLAIEAAKVCHSVIVCEELSEFSPKDKQELLSHIDECLKNEKLFVAEYEGVDLRSWKPFVNSFADFYYTQGRYTQAGSLYERLLKHPFRVDPVHQTQTMHALATVYHSLGRHYEAEFLYKDVLELREAQLGRSHRETLRTVECLANIYRSAARYLEAEDLYLEVLKGRETYLDRDHPDTLQVLANLANNYRSQGRYQEAETLYHQVFSGCERKLGANHSTTITVMNDLASNFQSQGKYSDAQDLYLQALEWRRINLGEDHPDTLWTMADLANNFQSQGLFQEAEALYRQTVAINESVLGMDHPETLWALDGLANVVRQQHHYDEAQVLYERALQGREKRLGPNHHNTLRTVKGLGMVHGEQGRYDEAEKLYKRALTGLQKQLGPDHPKTLSVIRILAQNYCSKRDYVEAKGLYTRALEGLSMRQGSNHPETLEIARHLEVLSRLSESQSQASGP